MSLTISNLRLMPSNFIHTHIFILWGRVCIIFCDFIFDMIRQYAFKPVEFVLKKLKQKKLEKKENESK